MLPIPPQKAGEMLRLSRWRCQPDTATALRTREVPMDRHEPAGQPSVGEEKPDPTALAAELKSLRALIRQLTERISVLERA